jgi:signal transduction histidine kinase
MRLSIRYQLLIPIITLLLGVMALSAWAAFGAAQRARRQIEMQVRNVARTLGDSNFPLTPRVLEQMEGLSGAEYLLVAEDGNWTATLPVDPVALPAPEEPTEDWQALRLGPPVRMGQQVYLCSGVRLRRGPNTGSTLYILYPESLWRGALWEAIRPALVFGLFGGLASVVLALGVAQRLSRRIQELERRTRLIAAGDFGPMPLPGRDDELRDLSRSVNEMAQQLAQLQETVRRSERLRLLGQVSGGLAHQLRNGAAGARLAVQQHARECDGRTDPETLAVALRQLTLLETHLKRFLDLGGKEESRYEPCSLPNLIDQAVALLRPQCRHAGIDLRWQAPAEDCTIQGDPGQLGHILLNVLHNAIDAAGPNGWVEVQVRLADGKGRCLVEVTDSGAGPPAEIAGRLFEPFVTGKPDGVGLGLAVARQVIEAHGGQISWSRRGPATCFSLELPLRSHPECEKILSSQPLHQSDTLEIPDATECASQPDPRG